MASLYIIKNGVSLGLKANRIYISKEGEETKEIPIHKVDRIIIFEGVKISSNLIQYAIENNIEIEVLPGATAFVTALVGSGMDTHKFVFEGFLDRDKKLRRKRLEEIKNEKRTIIFYESPHRLKETLKDMLKYLGNRKIAVNRELTKKYQEIIREDIETVIEIFNNREVKGEFVLIVEGFSGEVEEIGKYDDLSEREYVIQLMEEGINKKDAIKIVCKDRKLKKDIVYKQVLDL